MPATRPTSSIFVLLWTLGSAGALDAQVPEIELDPRMPASTARLLEDALAAPDVVVVTGDTTFPRGALHLGSIVQVGGTLVVEGRITDDVTAVDSDVYLRPGADIGGDLTVLGGGFYGSTMARVGGRQVWLREEPVTVDPRAADRIYVVYEPRPVGFPLEPKGLWGIVIHEYNGVDGLSFGLAAGLKKLPDQPRTELAFGPVFRSEREDEVGWDVVALREIPPAGLTIGGRAHRITDTHQRWQRSDLANSLLSVGLADDDRTYFERTGYELWAERGFLRPPLTFRVRWRDDDYDSLESQAPFSVFEGDDEAEPDPEDPESPRVDLDGWPVNPPIDEGRGRALGARLTLDQRNDRDYPTRGFLARIEFDHWGFGGDSTFEFDWGRVEGRGWLPLGGRSYVALRAIAGGRVSDGEIPSQFWWRLGGAGSVAGYDALHDSMIGDRMALGNLRAHLALPGSTRMFETVYLVGLADVGDAWFEDEDPAWNVGVGGGIAAHGRLRYVGLFAAYGVEDETWKAIFVATPWFDAP